MSILARYYFGMRFAGRIPPYGLRVPTDDQIMFQLKMWIK